MRKYSSLIVVLTLAVSLAACGGGENNNEVPGEAGNISDPGAAQPDNGSGNEPAAEQNGNSQEQQPPEAPAEMSGEPPAPTIDIELELEGMKETRKGTLAESDNGYYLYTLPQFKFTPEEPGTDQVYMDKFEDYHMRIQMLGDDANLDEVRASAEEELKSLSGSVIERKGDEIYDPFLREAKLFLHSSTNELTKDIIVLEIDGKLFKFTVNMPNGDATEGAEPGFWAMIKTVHPANA